MLSRMIVRLLLKAGLALALLLGVATYAHHRSGGDPGALWARVASGAAGGVADSFEELRGVLDAPLPTLAGSGGGSRSDSVFTWRDGDGVTHFASAPPPAGIAAEVVTVDPDTNVLAPVVVPRRARGHVTGGGVASSDGGSGATTDRAPDGAARVTGTAAHGGAGDADEPLPGIAGAVTRARGDAPAPDPARAAALLRLLRAPTN